MLILEGGFPAVREKVRSTAPDQKDINVSLNCPVAGMDGVSERYLDVGVLRTGGSPLSGTALLIAVFVELGFAEDGDAHALVLQRYGRAAVQSLLGLRAHGQHDGDRQVDGHVWNTSKYIYIYIYRLCVINYLLYDKRNQGKNEFSTIHSAVFNCRLSLISSYICTLKTHICARYLTRCVINMYTYPL